MMKEGMFRKVLVFTVIFLFIGLAIAPSITANVSKTSSGDELIEFTTEIYGIPRLKPQTVKLTKQQANEVEHLFDTMKRRLDNTTSREETITIFKQAVVELDKYGLLGGLSVEQTQKLVSEEFQNPKMMKLLESISSRWNGLGAKNLFCLVFANITNVDFMGIESFPIMIVTLILFSLGWGSKLASFLYMWSQTKPFRMMNFVAILNEDWENHAKFSVYSLGLLGYQNTIVADGYAYLMWGFTGMIIKYNRHDWNGAWWECDAIYFGSAIKTSLGCFAPDLSEI